MVLVGDLREKRYFFSSYGKANNCWKYVGKEKEIRCCERNEVIGMKKTMVLCKGTRDTKTRWVMQELRLVTSNTHQVKTTLRTLLRISYLKFGGPLI